MLFRWYAPDGRPLPDGLGKGEGRDFGLTGRLAKVTAANQISETDLAPIKWTPSSGAAEGNQGAKDNPHLKIYQAHGLIEVARLEANPVCVADSKQSRRTGQVFLVNVAAGPNPTIVYLADSFRDSLLLAANVHSVSLEYEDEPAAGLEKLRTWLPVFQRHGFIWWQI